MGLWMHYRRTDDGKPTGRQLEATLLLDAPAHDPVGSSKPEQAAPAKYDRVTLGHRAVRAKRGGFPCARRPTPHRHTAHRTGRREHYRATCLVRAIGEHTDEQIGNTKGHSR